MCKYDRGRQVLRKGDRIIFVSDRAEDNGHLRYGMTGTVLQDCPEDITWVYIAWDEALPNGHSNDGACEVGHGWNTSKLNVEKLQESAEFDACSDDEFTLFLGL